MDKFTDMHKSLMDSETAKTFVEVEAKGQELKKAVEDYRKAFVLACYGS